MADADAQGYLLLTLPDVRVSQVYGSNTTSLTSGEMRLECVSLPVDPAAGQRANPFADVSDPNKDLWLVLQVGETFELPLLPTQKVTVVPSLAPAAPKTSSAPSIPVKSSSLSGNPIPTTAKSGLNLSIPSAEKGSAASILLSFPPAEGPEDEEDIETFQVLLRQYGCLSLQGVTREVRSTAVVDSASPNATDTYPGTIQPPTVAPVSSAGKALPAGVSSTTSSLAPPSRPGLSSRPSAGRFVLVDESSGKVIGELDQTLSPEADAELAKTSDPVVVDFGQLKEGWSSGVTVKTIDEKQMEGDWLLKGAHYLSKGILTLGTGYKTGVTSAAEYYIKNSTPSAEPVKFHPAAKESIRQVHNVSAVGLKVTKKTLGVVQGAIGKVIEKTADVGEKEYKNIKEEIETSSAAGSRRGSMNLLKSPGSGSGSMSLYSDSAPGSRKGSISMFSDGASARRAQLNAEAEGASQASPFIEEPMSVSPTGSPGSFSDRKGSVMPPPPQRRVASGPAGPAGPPPVPKKEQAKGFLRKLLLAAEVVLTSVEATGEQVITSTTDAASSAAGHKYGAEAAHATQLLGGSVRSVALVYVDVAGVGRKTLIGGAKKGAKGIIKTRLADGTEVTLTQPVEGGAAEIQMADGQTVTEADLVIAVGDVKLDDQGRSVDVLKKQA